MARTALIGTLLGISVLAQTGGPVHVEPRAKPESPTAPIATHQQPFVSNVDLVLVPVTVTDPLSRFVTGLEKEHFTVFEDNVPEDIQYFYTQDTPISVGLIVDLSGSMSGVVSESMFAAEQFMRTANEQDEFFLISFASRPKLLKDFTSHDEDITGELIYSKTGGRTSLLDAIYLGLHKMRQAKYPRRALIVITDGGDNNSRYTPGEVLRVLREADVQLYTIGIPGSDYAPYFLKQMAESSGGRIYEGAGWVDTATKISIELRYQYVVGYRSRNSARDGQWRKIKLKLKPPQGLPNLHAYYKTGYYAPTP